MFWKQWARVLWLERMNEWMNDCVSGTPQLWYSLHEDVKPCGLVEVWQCCRETCYLHLQDRRLSCVIKVNLNIWNWSQELVLLASQCITMAVRWKEVKRLSEKAEQRRKAGQWNVPGVMRYHAEFSVGRFTKSSGRKTTLKAPLHCQLKRNDKIKKTQKQ